MDDTLTSFLRIYRDDDNEWYRLGPGETQNLFDNLLSRAETTEAEVEQLRKHCAVLEAQLSAAQESAAYHHQNYLRLLMIVDSVAEVHVL